MRGSKLILLAALTALLPNGVCSAQNASTTRPAQQWLDTINPVSGRPIRILGWTGPDGRVQFNPREYPQLVTKPAPTAPPQASPSQPAAPKYPPTGVIRAKIPTVSVGQVWHGGNVEQTFGANDVADKPPDAYLTIIGESEWDRSVVRANIERDPRFEALRNEMGDQLAIHDYAPDDVMVKNIGLADGGQPDIVIQDATGGEVERFHSNPGPGPIVEAIRRCNPLYQPGRQLVKSVEDWAIAAGVIGVIGISAFFGSLIAFKLIRGRA